MGEQWILDMTHQVHHQDAPPDEELYTNSIYRIPNILNDKNRQLYEPVLASFGPYHHGRSHLSYMEKLKKGALIQYLRRIAKASKTLDDVLIAMEKVAVQLTDSYDSLVIKDSDEDCYERGRLCHHHHHHHHTHPHPHPYPQPLPDWLKEKNKFLQLMITDGCFALEVMLAEKRSAAGEQSEYDSHDPVFGTERRKDFFPYLARDMLLLENQLPFLALTILSAIEGSGVGDVSTLIKSFYKFSSDSPVKVPTKQIFHILDLFKQILTAGGKYIWRDDHLTKELRFVVNSCINKPFRDINFNGVVLSLPGLEMQEATELILLNLIVFEHLHVTALPSNKGEQWISCLTKELQCAYASSKEYVKSIYLVPKIFTDINPEAYEPMLASFGPYHHSRPHLRCMEKHKLYALNQYLCRISKYSKTLQDVFIEMRKVQHKLLASYDSLHIEDYYEGDRFRGHDLLKKKDEFLNLMIVDGCFALEVMLTEKKSAFEEGRNDITYNPVFGIKRKKYFASYLARDMLLLENQLPFLALTTLASIKGSGIEDVSALIKDFYKLTWASVDDKMTDESLKAEKTCKPLWRKLGFLAWFLSLGVVNRQLESSPSIKSSLNKYKNKASVTQRLPSHILDLYREMLTDKGDYSPSYEKVHSATELRNAGVSFCKSKTNSFRDISFNHGILSLPALQIDDVTESLLLNLISFEQAHVAIDNKVTAYVVFMDNLIDTEGDVALLRKKGIINGMVGSEENVAKIFNKITKGTTPMLFRDDNSIDNVNKELNEYSKKRIPRWRASFVERHLKNPWVLISLIGALILLALTVLQTAYTIQQYYHG